MQNQEQFYRLFYSSDTGSSESSDYCQITEYIPPESQNEQECIKKNIKQEVEYVNWEDKFLLSKVLGDGHCIARCFAEYFDSSVESVLLKIKEEFKENLWRYLEYSSLDPHDVMDELDEYINLKKYNSSTIDLLFLALCYIYDCDIVVFDSCKEFPPQVIRKENKEESFNSGSKNRITLLREHDHYNLLIPVENLLTAISSPQQNFRYTFLHKW